MNTKIKVLLILLGIVSLLAVGVSILIYFSAHSALTEYAQRQSELEKQNTYLQEKLDSNLKQARHWQQKAEAVNSALNKLSNEHSLLQARYNSLVKEKESLSKESAGLAKQLDELKKRYAQERKKAVLPAQTQEPKAKVTAPQAQLKEIEQKSAQLEQAEDLISIELAPIIVTENRDTSYFSKKGDVSLFLSGRIITVNAQHKFAVIDIGRDSGVEKGMDFDVYRSGKKVGIVEVIQTRHNIAACDIKELSVRNLEVNDTVRLR